MPSTTTDNSTPPLPNPTGATNIFLLAADASPQLLPTLHANTSLLTSQDPTGYSLLHALASYNHLALLRSVTTTFHPPANILDSDGETALFVAETVEMAQYLVEEVGVDWRIRNAEGATAEERIREEGEYTVVADYLERVRRDKGGEEMEGANGNGNGANGESRDTNAAAPRIRPPEGLDVQVGAMGDEEVAELPEPDPEFRRRIEELAARGDFQGESGQAELRSLVEDAVRGVGGGERDVRRRLE